jgi:alkanesulfonate monooxygenase SsuD/methylene tetrahydromethanopterin reductase-like flavin-dependent oxidoreductase (luciferase family)
MVAGGAISTDFFTQMPRAAVAGKIRWATEAAEVIGRDPAEITWQSMVNYLAITGTEAEAERLREGIVRTIPVTMEDVREAPTILVGTPQSLAERIRRDRDELGFTDWVLIGGEVRGFGKVTTETFEQFSREVMPLVL